MTVGMMVWCAVVLVILAMVAFSWIKGYRHEFIVPEGHAGLLYHQGKFLKLLGTGAHVEWGQNFAFNTKDLRKTTLQVAGQEVLTADNVGVKLSVVATYQVADAVKAAHETQCWNADIYTAAQLALRAVVSGVTVEALLQQRLDIGAQLLARVQPELNKIGINILAVEVKDVTFAAELKRAFADVLKAKQEGQAALERARGESAALRNLANAARLMEDNPALLNLRMMQTVSGAQNAGNTLVIGMPGGFVPMTPSKVTTPPNVTEGE